MTTPDTNSRFSGEQLNAAERKLLDASLTGALVDLQAGDARLDDPAQAAAWGAGRTVRAEILVDLLTGDRVPEAGRPRTVKLRGARVTGALDLAGRVLACPLLLQHCHIDERVDLTEATASAIRLPGCQVPALTASQLRTTGNLEFSDGFRTRELRLDDAQIGGRLVLRGARLVNPRGPALSAQGMTVGQSMFCTGGFTAHGGVRLIDANISGQLNLRGASLANEHGPALSADQLTVTQSMHCSAGFSARGEVRLHGAQIGGQLNLTGASLANPDGVALTADGMRIGGAMICREGFTADGQTRLNGAHIGDQLDFSGASLANERGPALSADQLTVGQSMLCSAGFSARGQIRLHGATIGGVLGLDGASLANHGRRALTAESLTAASMVCREGFTANGEVSLASAHIVGVLNLTGASLENENGRALNAEGLTVGQDMLCRKSFSARGEVNLAGAHIVGRLDLTGASLENENGRALNAERLSVGQDIACREGFSARGEVSLVNAKAASFADDPASWPATIRLRGFVYDDLGNDHTSVRQRLGWLTRNTDGYVPQAYDQLATVYRNAGRDEWARRVAIAKQRKRRSAFNPLSWLWYATVGYGYRTWLAGAWLTVLLAVGTWLFSRAHMIATVAHPPAFHPFAYTTDVVLPIVGLGQKSAWQPQGPALYWSWALTMAGWILATAVVAGLTGVLKRD